MINPSQIQRHMDVVSSRNEPLGSVDHIQGSSVKLVRDVLGQHHLVPIAWIESIDDKIHLTRSAEEVERLWAGEPFQ
ncbi:MAG TPA: DUF2171 domain-containing protein [Polyangiaceae bacterium]|nr:DUF2171 domain-containing protein [Polyangiaceae bacterium]